MLDCSLFLNTCEQCMAISPVREKTPDSPRDTSIRSSSPREQRTSSLMQAIAGCCQKSPTLPAREQKGASFVDTGLLDKDGAETTESNVHDYVLHNLRTKGMLAYHTIGSILNFYSKHVNTASSSEYTVVCALNASGLKQPLVLRQPPHKFLKTHPGRQTTRVCIPILQSSHFTAIFIDLREKTIVHYDSLGKPMQDSTRTWITLTQPALEQARLEQARLEQALLEHAPPSQERPWSTIDIETDTNT